ncbi:RagB/SusD family nutrient uptake outer membrane protein [Aggregatimonas sangjinii]|uniref:RagB/SusD family nutrient uptake outer membrane protein n=1 Tax=Aggregatimonas sangjinii TaxID=2583587 RepID=A0A5B7SRC7_9FLAO|nr:RagB/SusD family nutrient uptake outer membrane protein [Aggregatimonas sangjinii]QCW99537.1 RagB/SusD family nutrient uptake outer membrane protein [Aggregatimonas sangjinii]
MKEKYIKDNLKYAVIFLLLMAVSVSCDDLVDEVPISEIAPTNFWRDNDDAQAGVIAIYDAMQTAYREDHLLWGELRSDNHDRGSESASATSVEIVTNNVTEGDPAATRWDVMYTMVNRANLAIDRIPQISGADQSLLGEALALRSYAYFTMVKVWGAVPLFTEPTEVAGPDLFKSRTDASTIMETIVVPDLLRAKELVASPSRPFRWSTASLLAYEAEVHMWMNDPASAKTALDEMIALGAHSLVDNIPDWEGLFYNNNDSEGPFLGLDGQFEDERGKLQVGSELIFSIFYDQLDPQQANGNFRGNRSGYSALLFAGLPGYYISGELELKWRDRFPIDSLGWVTKYPDSEPPLERVVFEEDDEGNVNEFLRPIYGDFRYYASIEDGVDVNPDETNADDEQVFEQRVAKWHKTNYNANFDDTDIVLYRYAGQLLLLAEAENRLGNTERALELVNEVREARLLPDASEEEFGDSVEERESYILDERQFELLGEGKRVWDLIRTDRFVETMNDAYLNRGESLIDETKILLPIFFEHFQENPNLGQQNPGYGAN